MIINIIIIIIIVVVVVDETCSGWGRGGVQNSLSACVVVRLSKCPKS